MIILMRAATCSGKSTFITKQFGDDIENHVLSSDKFREMLFGTKTEQRKNRIVFEKIHEFLEQRLQDRVPLTIMDSTHLRFKECETVIELSKRYHTPIMVISIQPPTMDVLRERNKNRQEQTGFNIPDEVIERHYNRYFTAIDPFIKEAMYNEYFKFTELDQEYNVIRLIEGKNLD